MASVVSSPVPRARRVMHADPRWHKPAEETLAISYSGGAQVLNISITRNDPVRAAELVNGTDCPQLRSQPIVHEADPIAEVMLIAIAAVATYFAAVKVSSQ